MNLEVEVLWDEGIDWILWCMLVEFRSFGESIGFREIILRFELNRRTFALIWMLEFHVHNLLKCFDFFNVAHLFFVILNDFLNVFCVVHDDTCFSSERSHVLFFWNILDIDLHKESEREREDFKGE